MIICSRSDTVRSCNMTNSAPVPQSQFPTAAVTAAESDACSTCPHSLERHDATALRYCAATLAAALSRGCICRSP